jgi:lambda family phage portal protein
VIGRIIDACIAPFAPALAARRFHARAEYEALAAAYTAGEHNRSTRDWTPRELSADAAILAEYNTTLPRARDTMRNNWAGRSAVKAYGRNVVGTGILPAAVAKDTKGKERRDFNEKRDELFVLWASRSKFCDVEKRQTFFRKCKMAVEEMVGVGQHFLIWSYTPNPGSVGLRLQSFEPEQLDIVKLVNPDNGNQIRRGIEVDDNGAAVAYWFYPRPMNDYYGFQPAGISGSLYWESVRHDADRVFHLMDQERTRQTHGVTWMAASMLKFRNTMTMDDAALQKAKVEASIALRINRPAVDTRGGIAPVGGVGLPPRNIGPNGGPDNVSRDGGRQYQFEPAMVFEGRPGDTLDISPQQNGGANYDPFMRTNLRAAAAGMGLSYDVVARDYDQGTYSSKRQGALEDRREFSISQDLLIDLICQNVIELFVGFAVLEGKFADVAGFDENDFYANSASYFETEWLPDGFQWIDPAKEAQAASIRLDKRLDTRKSIIGSGGGNWRRTFQQLADEQAEADRVGITLPDVEPTAHMTAGDAPPSPANDGSAPPNEIEDQDAPGPDDDETPPPPPPAAAPPKPASAPAAKPSKKKSLSLISDLLKSI